MSKDSYPIPVVCFFGGQSSEHEISCLTAGQVLAAIDQAHYQIDGVGITKDGTWVRYHADEIAALVTTPEGALPTVDASRPTAVLYRDADEVFLATRSGDQLVDPVPVAVAFPLLHGPFGEDGTLQGYFEMLGLRYVGAGVMASAVGMDKPTMKTLFIDAGLRVESYLVLDDSATADSTIATTAEAGLQYPVYVKPARSGSSVGITRVEQPADLPAAVTKARRWDPRVLVEQGVVGAREIECAVLGPAPGISEVRVSRPGEIIVHNDGQFYDYDAKYLNAVTAEVVAPADLHPAVEAGVRDAAVRAFKAIDAEGLSRVDFFVSADGSIIINEINTMPGFTQISQFPKMWEVEGMSYTDLISDLIEQALARPLGLR